MYISDVLREEFKLDLISTAILQHFAFWINKNASDGKNVNNEKCWTFQTLNQIAKYLKITVARVRYAIDKLVAKGYLIKDNFNKTAYDRTIWYSFKDEQILQKIISEINKKNPPINSQMEKIKLSNPSEEISEPIPKAKNKISTKEALNESQSKPKITFETISQEKKEISATLVSFKLSKMQTNRIIKEFDIPYIQSKIKQFEYISKNYPKKFKKYPKASYLYNSIYDNWEDEDYLKYYNYDLTGGSTGILINNPYNDIEFMFNSKEGIRLPDADGSIKYELEKQNKMDLSKINELIWEQGIIWPLSHFSNGIWTKDTIDVSNLNTAIPPIEFNWIGLK